MAGISYATPDSHVSGPSFALVRRGRASLLCLSRRYYRDKRAGELPVGEEAVDSSTWENTVLPGNRQSRVICRKRRDFRTPYRGLYSILGKAHTLLLGRWQGTLHNA